jgi:lysophospholipase L1-like esterase
MTMVFAFIGLLLAVLAVTEIIFRYHYRKRHGRPYHISIKFPWEQSYVAAHPYLSFAYKKNSWIDRNQRLPYPLHTNQYFSYTEPVRINNMGHIGEDFILDKPENTLRIACLGHSSTANVVGDGVRNHSYPEYLREFLASHSGELPRNASFEVGNWAIGGWLSIDVAIDFMLNVVHTNPDYFVLYFGYNDLYMHLQPEVALDYSHNRKNLGECLGEIKRGYYFPKLKWWNSYEYAKDRLFGTGNIRNEVLRRIIPHKPDYRCSLDRLQIEKNILKNILIIARYYNIRPVLASFVYYDYEKQPLAEKFAEGVRLENQLIGELAEEFESIFVDLATIVPQEDDYFFDCVHFTPKGMKLVAEHIGNAIRADLNMLHQSGAARNILP